MFYLREDGGVGGIGGVEERAGIYAESVGPEMEGSRYGGAGLGTGGCGVGDYFAGGVVAAEGAGCAGKVGGCGLGVVAAGAGHVPACSVRYIYNQDLRRTYLFARSMIFRFRSSGFSTARPDFSPPAYKF